MDWRLSEGSGRLSVGSGWLSIRFGRLYGPVSKSGRWVRRDVVGRSGGWVCQVVRYFRWVSKVDRLGSSGRFGMVWSKF